MTVMKATVKRRVEVGSIKVGKKKGFPGKNPVRRPTEQSRQRKTILEERALPAPCIRYSKTALGEYFRQPPSNNLKSSTTLPSVHLLRCTCKANKSGGA